LYWGGKGGGLLQKCCSKVLGEEGGGVQFLLGGFCVERGEVWKIFEKNENRNT